MATTPGTSNLKKPWAWLASVAVFGLVLASSTAIYVVNSSVKLPLPWWAAVAAPLVVYALVLPLCVPRLRMGGWLFGLCVLAVLHVLIALSTAWLYATVSFITFEQALPPALWGFPPALVLAMVGSLLMTLPFLGALAPRSAPPRPEKASPPPKAEPAKKPPPPAPDIIPAKDRQAWARGPAGTEPAAAAQTVGTLPTPAFAAPVLEEPAPAVEKQPPLGPQREPALDAPAVHAAPLLGVNGGAPEAVESETPAAVSDFRQALSELFGTPAAPPGDGEGPPAADELVADQPARDELVPDELVADEPSFAVEAAAEAPEGPGAKDPVVRIPFERVMGQLPPGAFRVPLGQVGARLRDAEMLVVPQALIVPQLGEGVVQVAWEVVAEQFPASVFAVAPGEMTERIVNGRLLLPLDEIVRQLPPELFAASIGRGPVEVPGIESFPAPFKPLGFEAPPEPATAEPVIDRAPAPMSEPVLEPVPEPALERRPEVVPEPAVEAAPAPVAERVPVEPRGNAEKLAALLAPWETAALDEVEVGDFAIVSVSAAGLPGGAVAAAAGRLSSVIARRAPRPVEQATLRGAGGALVLTPVGSGWNTGAALAVALRPGGPLARLELLARRAARAHEPQAAVSLRPGTQPAARLDSAETPAAAATLAEELEAFGPVTVKSYREAASGGVIHCFVPPGAPAEGLAAFAWELAHAMAPGAPSGPLDSFHSATLRSGSERYEIRRLPSAAGPARVLAVRGADTGRPGLARRQVERAAARLGTA